MLTVFLRVLALVSRHMPLVIALILGTTVYLHATRELGKNEDEQRQIADGQSTVIEAAARAESRARDKWKSAETYATDALDRAIQQAAAQIKKRRTEIDDIGLTISPGELVRKARLRVEIEALNQETSYLKRLRNAVFVNEQLERHHASCRRMNDVVQTCYAESQELARVMSRWGPLEDANATANPFSDEFRLRQRREKLESIVLRYGPKAVSCFRTHARKKKEVEQNPGVGPIDFSKGWADPALAELKDRERKLKTEIEQHWLNKAKRAFQAELRGPYLKEAIIIVARCIAGGVVLWLLVKLLFYKKLAPKASKAKPIQLVPDSDGKAEIVPINPSPSVGRDNASPVLLDVTLRSGTVLALRSEFFHSATDECRVSTRPVANRQCLSASVIANLYNLTEVGTKTQGQVTVSTGGLPLQEAAIISIPIGSAVCVLPAHIIGVLHDGQTPPHITKHLRLLNLQAWLTMRFRYLVFYGPVQLIMMGCRGLVLQTVDQERSVPHANTVGFSANLKYRVTQTETFWAYVTKKKQLLRDRFTGGPGVLIVERVPSGWKGRGLTNEGLDGFAEKTVDVVTSASGGA